MTIRTWRAGFSLTEMAIVILIVGIIGAVAAPRIFDSESMVEQNKTHRQLNVLRNAIDMYHARSGDYPPREAFVPTLSSLLSGPFPTPLVGSARGDQSIYFDTDQDVNTPVAPDPSRQGGWAYKPANGSLRLNLKPNEVGANW